MAVYYARVNNPNFENMSAYNGLYNQIVYTGMAVFSMSSAGVVLPVENNMADPKKFGLVLGIGKGQHHFKTTTSGFWGSPAYSID